MSPPDDPLSSLDDCVVNRPFMKYVGRLITEVGLQQVANQVKNRKLRALRTTKKRLEVQLARELGVPPEVIREWFPPAAKQTHED